MLVSVVVSAVVYGEKPFSEDEVIPTLETFLQELAEKPPMEAASFASSLGIETEGGRVRVVVEIDGLFSEEGVTRLGGTILSRAEYLHSLEVEVPIYSLIELAQLPGVSFVRRPYRPVPASVSQGVMVTGTSTWHAAGIRGQGITVAIIDGGFAGLSGALATGELGDVIFTRDYTGEGLEGGGVHGTACAEIVHDMVPDAQLMLLKINSGVDLYNAVDDAIIHGANVISHSMGWFNTNFYDGTGPIADIAGRAIGSGILWVNSAGNSADGGHWEGDWSDPDSDGWLDFFPGDEVDNLQLDAGETVELYLTWDAWPQTDQDYDLYLVDGRGRAIASSVGWQTGTQEPSEWISYTAPFAGSYGVAIYAHDAPAHPRLELFAIPYHLPLEYAVSASSITAPANAVDVFTVGAVDWRDWTTGPQEAFSSQGPTNTSQTSPFSLVKPDICGPDGTASASYSDWFYGTSAAAPHVAGAAALIWSAHPGWTAEEVRRSLEDSAVDLGPPGMDNLYGHGCLNLPSPQQPPSGMAHTYGAVAGWYMGSVPLNSGSAAELFGTTAYTYDPATGQYVVATNIEPYKGYWVYLPANKTVTDSGDQVTTDVLIDISTAGWWQISAPWSYPKSAIQVIKGTETKSWADAVAAGWVRDEIYGYTAVDGAYTTPSTIDPWYGYWVKAEVSGLSLKLLYASGTPVSASSFTTMAAPLAFAPRDLPPMPPFDPQAVASQLEFGNSPNPVTDVHTTHFQVSGPMAGLVEAIKVEIYDLSNRLVYSSGEVAGTSLAWHTDNDYGEYLANGVYLYKMYAKIAGQWVVSGVKTLAILR